MTGSVQGAAGANETVPAQAYGHVPGGRQVGPYSKSTPNNVDGITPNNSESDTAVTVTF
jgi:hypothetical protein